MKQLITLLQRRGRRAVALVMACALTLGTMSGTGVLEAAAATTVELSKTLESVAADSYANQADVQSLADAVVVTDATCADFQIVIPAGGPYDVQIHLAHYDSTGTGVEIWSNENYHVDILDGATGELTSTAYSFGNYWDSGLDYPELSVWIYSVTGGSILTVQNIVLSGTSSYVDFASVAAGVVATGNSGALQLTFDINNPTTLVAGQTLVATGSAEMTYPQNLTSDTFSGLGGEYDLRYMLANYNVVSFDDIEATHIIGPIIAQDEAFRMRSSIDATELGLAGTPKEDVPMQYSQNVLAASDYSRGISSYIGTMNARVAYPDESDVKLNYGIDFEYATLAGAVFTPPTLYTRSTEYTNGELSVGVVPGTLYNEPVEYISLERNGAYFLSPNNIGKTTTKQNNTYLDFDKLQDAMVEASQDLAIDGTIHGSTDIVYLDYSGYVKTDAFDLGVEVEIEVGKSYSITGSANIASLNVITPTDYDFFENPWLLPTTITFTESVIKPTYINGVLHSQIPTVYLDGELMSAIMGENGEYGEVGNKIIWNFPNVITDRVSGYNRLSMERDGENFPGHILAPQAEFWNYIENLNSDGTTSISWSGGNLNGTIIAADVHSGEMEIHLWPYDGEKEQAVSFDIEAIKTFENGTLSATGDFNFELNLVSALPTTGLKNDGFPYTATNKYGEVQFAELIFDEAGTYVFTVHEVVPDPADPEITYDTSLYTLTITVSEVEGELVATCVVLKDGVLYTGASVAGITETVRLPFHNVQGSAEETVDYTLYKTDQHGQFLPGAEFELTQLSPVVSGVTYTPVTIVSNSAGEILLTGLVKGADYKLVETKAPEDHEMGTGYWILAVGANGSMTFTPAEGAQVIGADKAIQNTCTAHEDMDVTLTKQNQLGTLLAGAQFQVTQVISATDHTALSNGYHQTVVSDAEGQIFIAELPKDAAFQISELIAPAGHVQETGYWILVTDTHGTYQIISDYATQAAVGDALLNYKPSYVLPSTGGPGVILGYGIGLCLMGGATYRGLSQKTWKRKKIEEEET